MKRFAVTNPATDDRGQESLGGEMSEHVHAQLQRVAQLRLVQRLLASGQVRDAQPVALEAQETEDLHKPPSCFLCGRTRSGQAARPPSEPEVTRRQCLHAGKLDLQLRRGIGIGMMARGHVYADPAWLTPARMAASHES